MKNLALSIATAIKSAYLLTQKRGNSMAGRKPLPDDQRKIERKAYLTGNTWARVDQLAERFGVDRAEVHRMLIADGLRVAERREARKKAHKNAHTAHNSGVEG